MWGTLLALTSGAGTLASRARNTPSYGYHLLAALGSHGTFILQTVVGLNLLIEALRTPGWHRTALACVVYTASSTLGSVLSHWVAMRFVERGSRRVGAYATESQS